MTTGRGPGSRRTTALNRNLACSRAAARRIGVLATVASLLAVSPAAGAIETTDAGDVRLAVDTDGYLGSFFETSAQPSCEYPQFSNVEHLYQAGLWVGARTPDGAPHVSSVTEDAVHRPAADALREFAGDAAAAQVRSNIPSSPDYHPLARAPWEMVYTLRDDAMTDGHTPLGLEVGVTVRAFSAWSLDDVVIIEYAVVNQSGGPLHDVYVGQFTDDTIGNTEYTSPYGGWPMWNWYDDVIGGQRPGESPHDPDGWLMHRHDNDGDDGYATSWMGWRLLGLSPAAAPPAGTAPVAYNAWTYNRVPRSDDYFTDPDGDLQPGKYQLMANGEFDVGVTADMDFTIPYNWMAMLSAGPVPTVADGDTVRAAFALVCAPDSVSLSINAAAAGVWYATGAAPVAAPVPAAATRLLPAAPNPFNPSTTVRYRLAAAGPVRVTVHALDGRLVRVLATGSRPAGDHAARWDGRDAHGAPAPSGRYVVRLEAGSLRDARGVTLVK